MGSHWATHAALAATLATISLGAGCTILGDEKLFEEIDAGPVATDTGVGCELPAVPQAVLDIFQASCSGPACHVGGGSAVGWPWMTGLSTPTPLA